jgi:3alpha(or 20beta)-hydroxysteroid dehydrogenase
MGKLEGRIAVITGGARGMGAATARLMAAEGAKVVIADIQDKDGEALAKSIGKQAIYRHLDVSDEDAWKSVAADAVKEFGGVDILVNNAGVLIFKTILETEKKDIEKILSVNVIGTFLGMKTMAPLMIKKKKGSIINISSVDGLKGSNAIGAYAASKWGIRGLTKVAALELGLQGVRVNSVHPGGINTEMGNPYQQPVEEFNKLFQRQPIQRVAAPEEVARVNVFLASDDASYMCGAELAVDGGMSIGGYYDVLPGGPAGL